MSIILNELFKANLSTGRLPFTSGASALLIFFVILLLVEKEIIRVSGHAYSKHWMRILDGFIIPGLVSVGFIIFGRLLALI